MSAPLISLATESDCAAIAKVHLEAFGRLLLLEITRPAHLRDPKATLEERCEIQGRQYKESFFGPKAFKWVLEKAEIDGIIVGYSAWKRPASSDSSSEETMAVAEIVETVNPEVDAEAIDRMLESYKANRDAVLGSRSHWYVHINSCVTSELTLCRYLKGLAVSPAYQGRGVGRALLERGLNRVDEDPEYHPAYVEATNEGVPLYTSQGFKEVGQWKVDDLKGSVYQAPVMLREREEVSVD